MTPKSRERETTDVAATQTATAVIQDVAPRPRSVTMLLLLGVCAALLFFSFTALGTWQLKRLFWKRDLIARVEQRVHAPAVAAPGQDRWQYISAETDEYRHVLVSGTFLHQFSVRVQATTELGSGFWLLTPLRQTKGTIVLINRGFISSKTSEHTQPYAGKNRTEDNFISNVTGLLRISEPGGAFLRRNDPATQRWHSRDVQAIATAQHLALVAPYFIDADAGINSNSGTDSAKNPALLHTATNQPIGGLTVIAFNNNHLVYTLTWYTLALMVAGAAYLVGRTELRLLRNSTNSGTRAGAGTCAIKRENENEETE